MHPSGIVSLMPAKDAGIRVRVDKKLRGAFAEACRAQGLFASDVLRDFMLGYAERHQNGLQGDLFLKRPEGRRNATKAISESATGR